MLLFQFGIVHHALCVGGSTPPLASGEIAQRGRAIVKCAGSNPALASGETVQWVEHNTCDVGKTKAHHF